MSMVEYTVATEEYHEEIYRLIYDVFSRTEETLNRHRLASRDPYYKPEHRHIVKVDGRVVSHVHLTHRVARIGVARVDIGGIMWVGTAPEHRGKDYGRQLMMNAISYLKGQGWVASPLTTSILDYYRPLGYEAYHDEVWTKVNTLALPKEDETAFSVVEYSPSDLPEVMSIYDEFYSDWTCTICRTKEYWGWILEHKMPEDLILVAKDKGRAIGYAASTGRDGLLAESANLKGYGQAYYALLSELRRRLIEKGTPDLTLSLPLHHPMSCIVRSLGGVTEVRQSGSSGLIKLMKVVGLGAYLKGITPELERRLLNSPLAGYRGVLGIMHSGEKLSPPEKITLHIEGGKVSVDGYADVGDVISGNERPVGQVLIGYRGLAEACNMGLVKTSSDRALELGSVLFPSTYPWRSNLDNATG